MKYNNESENFTNGQQFKKKIKIDDEQIVQKVSSFKLNLSYPSNIKIYDINKFNMVIKNNHYKSEIMSFINIKCKLQELINIFYIYHNDTYNIVMKDFYKKKFINGSILRKIPSDNEYLLLNGNQITVKKSYFLKSKFTKQNDEWCYIENYIPYDNGMSVSIITLSEHSNIKNLMGVINIELVYKDDSIYNKYDFFNINFHGYAHDNSRKTRQYLKLLANSLRILPSIIEKNRLSVQMPANLALCKINNTHCISCSRLLKCFIFLRKRCELCSLFVCKKCVIKKEIRTLNRYNCKIIICIRCVKCIDRCDYSNIKFYNNQSFARIILDPSNEDNAYHRLKNYLKKKSNNPSLSNLYYNIIENDNEDNNYHMFRRFSHEFKEEDSLCFDVTNDLDNCFNFMPSPSSCDLLSSRSYPLNIESSDSMLEPIPNNELERTEYLNNLDIDTLRNIQ